MEKNEEKKSTSIQYQMSNNELFREVFNNWNNFNEELKKGPENFQKYLFEMWNRVKEKLKENKELIIKDIDKEVKPSDFYTIYNETKNGTSIFFISFPDFDYTDPASKYVALAFTPYMPRYFTLEYSIDFFNQKPCWVIGEFVIKESNRSHINYGTTDNMKLSWFIEYITKFLESKNL